VRNAIIFAAVVIMSLSTIAQARPKHTPAIAQEHHVTDSRLSVRVYDTEMMPAADQAAALRAAAGVLAAAGIDVTWVACADPAAVSSCGMPLRGAELSVRFVRLPAAVSAHGQLQLGYSLVDTQAREGRLATIFVDRVQWLAAETRADNGTLLGFAVAHEIGHLLLGTNTHATNGLMRAIWSRTEIERADARDWLFSTIDASRMRASLAQRYGLRSPERDPADCSAARDHHPDASTECGRTALAALRGVAAGSDR
jgi:hypothetical protein